tara:strand:+ start:4407 stop:4748 length:342 start_codon:yes stop_codon:yes gene_type:complete
VSITVIDKAFEVKVKIGKLIKAYLYYRSDGVKSHRQAARKAKKHGKVISVEKVDAQALLGRIENLDLSEESERYYLGGGVFEDELDIDGVLGLSKKIKRRSTNGRTYKDTEKD